MEDLLWQNANRVFMGQTQPSWLYGRLCSFFFQRRTQIQFDSGLITFLQLLILILIRSYIQNAIGVGSRGRCRLGLADLS